jgi:cobyric acid synthase CobQ
VGTPLPPVVPLFDGDGALSREFLLHRGYCCENGCRNCPYGFRRPLGRTLMFQGTASHVGKSVVTAAACRWLARQGLRVAPFKAQNMSLNSAVTADGGEIGRSQAFQAAACGIEPETAMNPMLLKPMAGRRCQVILNGKPYCVTDGYGSAEHVPLALEVAGECLAGLRRRFDVVVIEGMGSPAEINLRERDVANMRTAELADAPVLLIGSIERGGVFAALAGTLELLAPSERARVKGFLINGFHGDPAVLASGCAELEQRYGVPTVGVLPWLPDLRVEEEDGVALAHRAASSHSPTLPLSRSPGATLDVLVPRLPAISNFTDLAPLEAETGVAVRYIERVADWGAPDLVVLPGSRSVAADLVWLRERGLDRCLREHADAGGWIIGLCGGYQMLGRDIGDPDGVEGGEPVVSGLGLLDVVTTFAPEKTLARAEGTALLPGLEGLPVAGYEIHHGVTERGSSTRPAFRLTAQEGERLDGAVDASGRIFGTYLHGLFDRFELRAALLGQIAPGWNGPSAESSHLSVFDRLADWWQAHVDLAYVQSLLRLSGD